MSNHDHHLIDELKRLISKSEQRRVTVRELWELYTTEQRANANSWGIRKYEWSANVGPFFGERIAAELTDKDVSEYRALRTSQPSSRTGLPYTSPWTRNKEVSLLLNIMECGARHGLIARNQLRGTPREKTGPLRETILTPEHLKKLRPHCTAEMWALACVAASSGLRSTEIRTLRWSDIDLARGIVFVRAANAKGGKAGRVSILSDEAVLVLSAFDRVSEWVFPSPRNPDRPLPKQTLTWRWNQVRTAAGIAGADGGSVWIHDARRGFGTRTHQAGVPLGDVLKLGGWVSPEVFVRHYYRMEMGRVLEVRKMLTRGERKGPRRIGLPAMGDTNKKR